MNQYSTTRYDTNQQQSAVVTAATFVYLNQNRIYILDSINSHKIMVNEENISIN